MNTPQIFRDQGLHQIFDMVSAINRIPYQPRLIQALNIFQDTPTNTITPLIERRLGTRQLIDGEPFGVRKHTYDTPNREGKPCRTYSINTSSKVMKHDTVGMRRFGTTEVDSVAATVADRLEWMRHDAIESTIESWRMQCLLGSITNTTGQVLANWYNFFGITPTTENFSVASMTGPTSVMRFCKRIKDRINDALQGIPSTGFVCILGDTAWELLLSVPEIAEAYRYRNVGDQAYSVAFTVNTFGTPHPDQTTINWGALAQVFTYAGITFFNYRASVDFPASRAVFFPMGVRDMFQSILSPSSLYSEAGAFGQPFYAHSWVDPDDSGMNIYVETQRIEACVLPEAVIQSTFS